MIWKWKERIEIVAIARLFLYVSKLSDDTKPDEAVLKAVASFLYLVSKHFDSKVIALLLSVKG